MAAVPLAALQMEGFLRATEAAITLAAITVAAEIEHRSTDREDRDVLASRGKSPRLVVLLCGAIITGKVGVSAQLSVCINREKLP
jgi:hypothetical protein